MMSPEIMSKLKKAEENRARSNAGQRPSGPALKLAEKIVIGFKNPTTAGKLYVLVREVNALTPELYHTTVQDDEGYTVGYHPERIFAKQESAQEEIDNYINREEGWRVEPKTHPARERTYEE